MEKGFLTWDEYFMSLAIVSSLKSKDPNTKVGACLVNKQNRVVSLGYNGMPNGCDDSKMPWGNSSKEFLKSKYAFVCHAELNAILNAKGKELLNSKIYTTLFPCNECAKAIIQAGIVEVIYLADKYAKTNSVLAAKKMFDLAKVKFKFFKSEKKEIVLKF